LSKPPPRSRPTIVSVLGKNESLLGGSLLNAGGERAVGEFHVTVYVCNPKSVHVATEAMLDRTPIALSGFIDDEVKTVTGFVHSIEEDVDAVPPRWRVTIREDGGQNSARIVSFLQP
jgi:hypothetical protein